MDRAKKIEIVESYINGLGNKRDFSGVPFAPDVTFENPMTPKLHGVEAVTSYLSGLFPAIKGCRIQDHVIEGEYVASLFDFETVFGVIPVFDRFRIDLGTGQIKEIRPYYDPRTITEAAVAGNKDQIAQYFAALSGKAKPATIVAEFSDSPELKQHIEVFEGAFPKYELFADEMIAEGDKVVVRARFRGTHNGNLMGIAPTGKTAALPFIIVYQVAGGKITGFNLAIDQMDLMKQLGVVQ
ncbi:MAG: ester cyclase [Blastocatellia bacterium]